LAGVSITPLKAGYLGGVDTAYARKPLLRDGSLGPQRSSIARELLYRIGTTLAYAAILPLMPVPESGYSGSNHRLPAISGTSA